MVGANLAHLPEESYDILLAEEVIAVNQDPLGVAGDLIWKQGPSEVINIFQDLLENKLQARNAK